MAKRKRPPSPSQSSSQDSVPIRSGHPATARIKHTNAGERLGIDEAFQRLLKHFGKPPVARHQLQEAIRAGEVQLWGTRAGHSWFPVQPEFFEQHFIIAAREGPDGWHAELAMRVAVQDFDKTEWAVSGKEVEALCEDKGSPKRKRGPKPYDDWDLFHAQCIRLLDTDDVGAYENVNISGLAKRLTEWGYNHLGEDKTPDQSAMRGKVSAWVKTWQRLRKLEKELLTNSSK